MFVLVDLACRLQHDFCWDSLMSPPAFTHQRFGDTPLPVQKHLLDLHPPFCSLMKTFKVQTSVSLCLNSGPGLCVAT